MKKAQSSLEFLMILGIALVFTIVLGGIFFSFSNSSHKTLNSEQVNRIGNDLMRSIDEMYFRGPGNKIQYKANFPGDIVNFTIHYFQNSSLNYSYLNISKYSDDEVHEHLFFPAETYIHFACEKCYNFSDGANNTYFYNESAFSNGPKKVSIKATSNEVMIDFVQE